MTDRDTHFLGFAKLLMQDLDIDLVNDLTQQIIAQRAYDLACHVLSSANERMNLKLTSIKAWVDLGIPDLTQWPD